VRFCPCTKDTDNTRLIIGIRGWSSIHPNTTNNETVGKNIQIGRETRARNPRMRLVESSLASSNLSLVWEEYHPLLQDQGPKL
jgi:hypothetical protein